MPRAQMTGRERLLTTIAHEEPDRVPISPRITAWMIAQYGDGSLASQLEHLPDMDFMEVVSDGTPNYIISYPDEYPLTDVRVDQKRYQDGNYQVVERTFHTPAGPVSDCTRIPPGGREYGVSPNPIKSEYLVKTRDDLAALRYILPPVNTNFDHYHAAQEQMGDRGVPMVCVRSALDHQAGDARSMADLMMDFYDDREFLEEMIDIFHQRSVEQVRSALEAGCLFIFGSWYFTSVSAGWSPSLFEELFIPMIAEHVELTHSYDAYYDFYDDGKLSQTMGMIAQTGIDVLETCTPYPVGDFDLAEAKKTIGDKTTLKGYVDLLYVVKHGTPELVEQTVREAMEIAKPGGGFIIGSSDSFREGTPLRNVETYFDACKRYGKY